MWACQMRTLQHKLGAVNNCQKVAHVFGPNSLLLVELGCGRHLLWGQAPCQTSSMSMSLGNTHGPWCRISKQVDGYHGEPHHLNEVLVFDLLWGNASDYPWQVIPTQRPSNICKPWWGDAGGWPLDSASCGMTSKLEGLVSLSGH